MNERGQESTITSYDVRRVAEVYSDTGEVTEIKVDYLDDDEVRSARVVLNGFAAVIERDRSRHVGHYDGHPDQFAILVIDRAVAGHNARRHADDSRPLRPIGTLVVAEDLSNE